MLCRPPAVVRGLNLTALKQVRAPNSSRILYRVSEGRDAAQRAGVVHA